MIPPINHVADWSSISQRKQNQLDKYVICENITIIDHDYRVADQVMMGIKSGFKYETLFKGTYRNVQTWKNGSVTLRTRAVTTRVNILCIQTYKNNKNANVFNKDER